MKPLRIKRSAVTANNSIRIQFDSNINPDVSISNIEISSPIPSTPIPIALSSIINGDILNLYFTPFSPVTKYSITLLSTDVVPFSSVDGQSIVVEDGKNNIVNFTSWEDPADDFKASMIELLSDNIYDLSPQTPVGSSIDSNSKYISKADHDVQAVGNENYLEIQITDEKKIRGAGAFDRLNEESAFEITRVGLNPTDSPLSMSINFDPFPRDIITLQRQVVVNETLEIGSGPGTFDQLTLTLYNKPVTKATSIIVSYSDGYVFNYNINQYGYRLLEPKYDVRSSKLLTLSSDQIKLSDAILDTDFRVPVAGDLITVSYEFKSLGRRVNLDTVTVTQIVQEDREVTPPILNVFNLSNAPIVNSNGTVPTIDGCDFLDPFSNPPFSKTHPAFIKEIEYNINYLPKGPGEYCVDYESGRVFVWGASTNDGTGDFPPAASYSYLRTFDNILDYSINPDNSDLVAIPNRSLWETSASINFNFEQVLIPGVDYVANVHIEALNERVDNRLPSLNAIYTLNSPITNVFRIINETSGEIYLLNRFTDNKVYFDFTTPPNVESVEFERVSFENVQNETLIVESEITNSLSTRIFKIILPNQNIISNTEDSIGSSFNSSATFSRNDLFSTELYYDQQTGDQASNMDRLNVGQYSINYVDGIVYIAVDNAQPYDVGTITYKAPKILTDNKHIISVGNIYNYINNYEVPAGYISFSDNTVTPSTFNLSDERFLNDNISYPYIVDNGTITVTDDILAIRGIYDLYDLENNVVPLNFAGGATISGKTITISSSSVEMRYVTTVSSGNIITVPTISPGVQIGAVSSVLRNDGVQLIVSSFSGYQINLSTGTIGDNVTVIYYLTLNGSATPIIDYDRGGLYIDYSYLSDEILISYEYGDNSIDFRTSTSIDEGKNYYVSYKVGALRDTLYNNFGALVSVPRLETFTDDTSFEREPYRDLLQGALQTFPTGPTKVAIENLVKAVTKVKPEIIEAIFDSWVIGFSNLYRSQPFYSKDIEIKPGKYDGGAYFGTGDYLELPALSNFKLDRGTVEFWIIPDWNGLDNDATIEFTTFQVDGYNLSANEIFIGSSGYHPTIKDGKFSINKRDVISPNGLPADIYHTYGLFIYLDEDSNRWRIYTKGMGTEIFTIKMSTSGSLYDSKPTNPLAFNYYRTKLKNLEIQTNLTSSTMTDINGTNVGGYLAEHTFMSDDVHYLIDTAETVSKNRISVYKDGQGYIVFEIWDNGRKPYGNKKYTVSYDARNWSSNEPHHVAIAWRLGTFEKRDEMHLFIDGLEVPNILRYGTAPYSVITDRFGEVKPELLSGTVPKNTYTGYTMKSTIGSSVFTDQDIDFTTLGISPGDTLDIDEVGFGTYTIVSIGVNSLVLSSPAAATLENLEYTINRYTIVTDTNIDLYGNIAVSLIQGAVETEIPGRRAFRPAYAIDKNAQLQNVLVLQDQAKAGDQIAIRSLGLNYKRTRGSIYLWGDLQNIIKTKLPPPINLDEVVIKPVILTKFAVGPSSAIISGLNFESNVTTTSVSNTTEGRKLSVIISGTNIDWSTNPTVEITGTSSGGPSETLTFAESGAQESLNKWQTITNVKITIKPYSLSRDAGIVEIKESKSITNSDGNTSFPIIRYSFENASGTDLTGSGDLITGADFRQSDVGDTLVISSPALVAGSYNIVEFIDQNNIKIDTSLPAFTGGVYKIYKKTFGRNGFQNGFFTFELANSNNTPYPLPEGRYEFDYSSYLEIDFDNFNNRNLVIGNSFDKQHPADATIDEFRSLSKQLTDIRVGESVGPSGKSVTLDYQSVIPFVPDSSTLTLLHFDNKPFLNEALFYKIADRNYLQYEDSVNSRFGQSLIASERGVRFENDGKLSTSNSGTIEFWVSPEFETINDPVERYYFDASSISDQKINSLTKNTIKLNSRIESIYSIRLASDESKAGTDYSVGAVILNDRQTVQLAISLPATNTPVTVSYVPSGFIGDRISIFKDREGFLNFKVLADGKEFVISQPIFWQRHTWHRILCQYKFNSTNNNDEMRMFVDGEETGVFLYGSGLLYGAGAVYGQNRTSSSRSSLVADINFYDSINYFTLGSQFNGISIAAARFDNLKISNTYRAPVIVAGSPRDVYYQTNLNATSPTIQDLFTTYLMNFNSLIEVVKDFATVRDRESGLFNFIINVIDSFDIVSSSIKVENVLRDLILAFKPAQSKVKINIE